MLSDNQKRVLRAFARTGIVAQRDLEAIPRWRVSLASLMTQGLVTTLGQCWMLTKEGGAAMPEVVEEWQEGDTSAFDRDNDARDRVSSID